MKVSYYGYSLERQSDNEKHLVDLRNFFEALSTSDNVKFKNQFTHAGENVYLLKGGENFYLYLITRSNEVIKKIKSTDHSISAINDMLQRDESLGFSSYVYFQKHYLGFASTIMAPKTKSFSNFVNEVIEAVGISGYRFVLHPFMQEATFPEALSMPIIGRSSVQVSKENKLYDDIREFFGGSAEEFADVDSFELTIKPKNRKNIDTAVKRIINGIHHNGLEKFICRAKAESSDHLMDLYLVGEGMISDIIPKGPDIEILDAISKRVKENKDLIEKVEEHENDFRLSKEQIKAFSSGDSVSSWADKLSDL